MKCQQCGSPTCVIDTRLVEGFEHVQPYIRRRRQCEANPAHRFTTHEMLIEESLADHVNQLDTVLEAMKLALTGHWENKPWKIVKSALVLYGVTAKAVSIELGYSDGWLSKRFDSESISEREARELLDKILKLRSLNVSR